MAQVLGCSCGWQQRAQSYEMTAATSRTDGRVLAGQGFEEYREVHLLTRMRLGGCGCAQQAAAQGEFVGAMPVGEKAVVSDALESGR